MCGHDGCNVVGSGLADLFIARFATGLGIVVDEGPRDWLCAVYAVKAFAVVVMVKSYDRLASNDIGASEWVGVGGLEGYVCILMAASLVKTFTVVEIAFLDHVRFTKTKDGLCTLFAISLLVTGCPVLLTNGLMIYGLPKGFFVVWPNVQVFFNDDFDAAVEAYFIDAISLATQGLFKPVITCRWCYSYAFRILFHCKSGKSRYGEKLVQKLRRVGSCLAFLH